MSGLYVRSNVQSLTSQNYLNRNIADLSNIMTRLSTGLRINSGKDDPAGLIASELMKSDMTATKAISNTQRANSMISIADSALGQIGNLLNDIRGLVNEAASSATMTNEQLIANQLQVNAALDSIDRIAKTTNYLGKNILDGTFDFETSGLDSSAVSGLSIYQANFGTQSEMNVGIHVLQDAGAARLFYDKAYVSSDTVLEVKGNGGSTLVNVTGGESVESIANAINAVSDSTGVRAVVGNEATAGQIFLTSAGLDNDINLTALMTGAAAGNYTVKFSAGDSDQTTYTLTEPSNGKPGILEFKLKMQPNAAPSADKFDESYNGLYTYDISGDTAANGTDIVVQSTNGQQIKHIEYVASAAANPSIPGGVAATFNKTTGKLQILYDAATASNPTELALKNAIDAIDGLEYKGIYTDSDLQEDADADSALQTFLSASGTGTKAAIDMRANNALNISAAVPGTKFENTDIVYSKAVGTSFTETFKLGSQNLYITTDTDPPTNVDGKTVTFISGAANGVDKNAATGNVEVTLGPNATITEVENLLKGNTGFDDSNLQFLDPTGTPVVGTNSAMALVGKTLSFGNVQLGYNDAASAAAATITLNNNTGDSADVVKMRIVANTVGTDLNDIAIEFEQDNTFKPGDVSVVYDEERKILHIRGQIDGTNAASYGTLKSAIEKASPFHVDVTSLATGTAYPLSTKIHDGLSDADATETTGLSNAPGSNAVIKTGQYVGDVGGDHQTLYINVAADATANDVVDAFRNAKGTAAQIASNFVVSQALDNNGTGMIFSSTLDADANIRVFSGALTGGNSGLITDVTSKELVDFINNDAALSQLFHADVARNQVGNGLITLFDEAAYYGSTDDDNALQFLGPEGSLDVLFVNDGADQQLGLSWVDNYGSGCITDDRPIASLNAANANAAFSVQATSGGTEYDDMVVRMIRLDNNHAATDSYAQYQSGPSNAMAYCSIVNDPTTDGTTTEQGKFIIYANQGGNQLNNVEIVAQLDVNQAEKATARYDEASKKFIVTVNSETVQLTDAVAAINNEGTFHAEYDYSFNTDPTTGANSNGPGLATFADILSTSGSASAVIGNTGDTGGHKGGVLEVYVGGDATEITANRVIDTINNSPTVKSLFTGKAIGGADAGTGIINFRADNVKTVIGSDGKTTYETNMVTDILGSDDNAPGYMVVHLATDANGDSITTAKDLVKFFDELTPEQTRGVSVSIVRPAGVDNLNRVWTVDNCDNVTETQICEDNYGFGILNPTYEVDECYNYTYYPIEFFSYGEDIQNSNAYGSVIAQNGKDASLNIKAKVTGPDYNGVGFKYVKLDNPLEAMYAEYDTANKMVIVHIQDGATASQVASAISTSAGTKDLFEVTLPGNGSGVVTLQDDYMIMKNGLTDVGYRGGAAMLGAADADAHRLILESTEEGSQQFVTVRTMDGAAFNVTDANGNITDTSHGIDMVATINGMKARAEGRSLSLESAMLKMGITLDDKVTAGDTVNFSIIGGGAIVQTGTEVVSNQQIRFAIQSVSTANLGGVSGKLYQLREGGIADLITSDESRRLADKIVQESILSVAQTRGRIGAIQRYTLEPQITALQDSLVALTEAEAQISNADFAEESSKLTRAQILVQAGTRTLSLANQFPQYAASLLGG